MTNIETWWGVHEINKPPVYLYKSQHAASNQASRGSEWIVSPFFVQEQTPETQEYVFRHSQNREILFGVIGYVIGVVLTALLFF